MSIRSFLQQAALIDEDVVEVRKILHETNEIWSQMILGAKGLEALIRT